MLGDKNDDAVEANHEIGNIVQILHLTQLIKEPIRITATWKCQNSNFAINSDGVSYSLGDYELITAKTDVQKRRIPVVKTYHSLENCFHNSFCQLLLNGPHLLNGILNIDYINE